MAKKEGSWILRCCECGVYQVNTPVKEGVWQKAPSNDQFDSLSEDYRVSHGFCPNCFDDIKQKLLSEKHQSANQDSVAISPPRQAIFS